MMRLTTDSDLMFTNPLDDVEIVLHACDWDFDRITDTEIYVTVEGKFCTYHVLFIWQADMNALQFCCQYDLHITDARRTEVSDTLRRMNEESWMGHFDIPPETDKPTFRHTCLMRMHDDMNVNAHVQDVLDIAMQQCESAYPAFQSLTHCTDDEKSGAMGTLELALMRTHGHA